MKSLASPDLSDTFSFPRAGNIRAGWQAHGINNRAPGANLRLKSRHTRSPESVDSLTAVS